LLYSLVYFLPIEKKPRCMKWYCYQLILKKLVSAVQNVELTYSMYGKHIWNDTYSLTFGLCSSPVVPRSIAQKELLLMHSTLISMLTYRLTTPPPTNYHGNLYFTAYWHPPGCDGNAMIDLWPRLLWSMKWGDPKISNF